MIELPLTRGLFSVISDEDSDLAELKWHAVPILTYRNGGSFYASRAVYRDGEWHNPRKIHLHRVILACMLGRELERCDYTDHINHDTLDNRRENLRLSTGSQNAANARLSKANASGYKGVSWDKTRGKWQASIMIKGVKYHLGRFDTPEVAYAAYCKAAREAFGDFAHIPDTRNQTFSAPDYDRLDLSRYGATEHPQYRELLSKATP